MGWSCLLRIHSPMPASLWSTASVLSKEGIFWLCLWYLMNVHHLNCSLLFGFTNTTKTTPIRTIKVLPNLPQQISKELCIFVNSGLATWTGEIVKRKKSFKLFMFYIDRCKSGIDKTQNSNNGSTYHWLIVCVPVGRMHPRTINMYNPIKTIEIE